MKKTFFAALCCAVLFCFSSCEETVTSDVFVSTSNTIGGGSFADVTLSTQAMNIFIEELIKVGGTQVTDSQTGEKILAVILRQQTDDSAVKQKVEQAAGSADKRVKTELNLPNAISSGCIEFLIHVYYSHVKDADNTQLTYTYKSKNN